MNQNHELRPNRDLLSWIVVGIGLISSLGYITNREILRGLGQLTVASPLPLVFSAFRGIETFALRFEAHARSVDGTQTRLEITPQVYSRFQAPYPLRNVYGAVISYGPGFREPRELKLVDSVLKHGFCAGGPLARNFGLLQPVERISIRATSMSASRPGDWMLQANCNEGERP